MGGWQKGRAKTGGRQKGTPNKLPHPRQKMIYEGLALARKANRKPLEFLLGVMNDEPWTRKLTPQQFQAAIAAAPYVHPRLGMVAYAAAPDTAALARRDMLKGLGYQQRQAILDIIATAQVVDGAAAADSDGDSDGQRQIEGSVEPDEDGNDG